MTRVIDNRHGEWPVMLDELGRSAPKRLFARGIEIPADALAIGVVGTRRPTGAGMEAAYGIARGLAEAGVVVVSGLAVGIDAIAHRAALEGGGHTVAVLGCGMDVRYPARNVKLKERIAEEGTLISEYPPGTSPNKHQFPQRNRIIAGLTVGVVVVEGAITSGALVTARLAIDSNRSVWAIPGSVRNPMSAGPNELIRTAQAALVTNVEHIFEDVAPALAGKLLCESKAPAAPIDETERAVLDALDDVPLMPEHISASVDLPAGRLLAVLSMLELKGMVARDRGAYSIAAAGARARSSG